MIQTLVPTLYNVNSDSNIGPYKLQQKQSKRPKTPEETEQAVEHYKQGGLAIIGGTGGVGAGFNYALANGATAYSTAALSVAGGILGVLVLGGLIGLGAYHLFFKGRREKDSKYPLVRKRSVFYALLDKLEKLWNEGSSKQALVPAYATY